MTTKELLEIAERELSMRRLVYPGMVQRGTMTAHKAAREERGMEEIADMLRAKWEAENPELFKT